MRAGLALSVLLVAAAPPAARTCGGDGVVLRFDPAVVEQAAAAARDGAPADLSHAGILDVAAPVAVAPAGVVLPAGTFGVGLEPRAGGVLAIVLHRADRLRTRIALDVAPPAEPGDAQGVAPALSCEDAGPRALRIGVAGSAGLLRWEPLAPRPEPAGSAASAPARDATVGAPPSRRAPRSDRLREVVRKRRAARGE